MKREKTKSPMEKLTAGYEKFIQGKQTNLGGQQTFNKAIKKAAKVKKQRGSK